MKSDDRYNLENDSSSGIYQRWFRSFNNLDLIPTRFAKRCGIYLGEVVSIQSEQVTVRLSDNINDSETQRLKNTKRSEAISHYQHPPIKPGDCVVFENSHFDVHEEGRVYVAEYYRQYVTLTVRQQDFNLNRVQVGDRAWKQ